MEERETFIGLSQAGASALVLNWRIRSVCATGMVRDSGPNRWPGAVWFHDFRRADKHLGEVQGPGIQGLQRPRCFEVLPWSHFIDTAHMAKANTLV